ncbi:hypothetical protein AAF712_005665 [Marasmius tenuissimus]|uniref:Uncharacterized protein n=1 Tax=Marasmius tenuissimus TaxID=585030 RepID=A0ABR3A0W1_9AGAR
MSLNDPYEEVLSRCPLFLTSIDALNFDDGKLYWAAFGRVISLASILQTIIYRIQLSLQDHDPKIDQQKLAEANREKEELRCAEPGKRRGRKVLQLIGMDLNTLKQLEPVFYLQSVQSLVAVDINDRQWIEWRGKHDVFRELKNVLLRSILTPIFTKGHPLHSSPVSTTSSLLVRHSSLSPCGFITVASTYPLFFCIMEKTLSERAHGDHRPTLSQTDTRLIRLYAPRLESLQLDTSRTTNPQENEAGIYFIISSFPKLRTLVIYYNLGLHHAYHREYWFRLKNWSELRIKKEKDEFLATYSRADHQFARDVWGAVKGRQLESMTLYMGDPDRETAAGFGRSSGGGK